jgi:[acyl-carrier-protein] S-malonyltransferase
MGLGLLFPGQGAQHSQMLPWLEAQPGALSTLAALARHLGPGWRESLSDPVWLHANVVAQQLMTGVSLAAWQVLAPQLPPPAVVAGYSVGELAAFAAAGVFDTATVLGLAAARAQAMNDSVAGRDTGLLAVQGPRALSLAEAALPIAIRIGAERVIVGGLGAELDSCAACWSAAGLRCTRLPIAIASHTPFMAAAAAAFATRLAGTELQAPRAAIVCNFTGTASRNTGALASALAGQIASTVRWDDCMDSVAERGVRCVLEVGPGSALAAMWRERHPDVPVRSVDEFQGPEGVLGWVHSQLG